LGASPTKKPLVTTVQFGDGYEQRVAESLNRVRKTWDLTFSGPASLILEIDTFLTDRAGVEAFSWTDTIGRSAAYVCREWQGPIQQERGLYMINATFEEVFES
jgi:phage-related protein